METFLSSGLRAYGRCPENPRPPPEAGCCPQTCGWGRLPLCLQGPLPQPRPQQHKGVSSVRRTSQPPRQTPGEKSKSPAPSGPRCSPQITDNSGPKATAQAPPGPPEMRCPFCPRWQGWLASPSSPPETKESCTLLWDFEVATRVDAARLAPLCHTGNAAGSR